MHTALSIMGAFLRCKLAGRTFCGCRIFATRLQADPSAPIRQKDKEFLSSAAHEMEVTPSLLIVPYVPYGSLGCPLCPIGPLCPFPFDCPLCPVSGACYAISFWESCVGSMSAPPMLALRWCLAIARLIFTFCDASSLMSLVSLGSAPFVDRGSHSNFHLEVI